MKKNIVWFRIGFGCCALMAAGLVLAQSGAFVVDGRLVVADGRSSKVVDINAGGGRSADADASQVSQYWGTLDDGRLLVTMKHDHGAADSDDVNGTDHTCSTASPGEVAFLIQGDGRQMDPVSDDVLRAYPSPVGDRIAVISPLRDLLLWDDGKLTTVTAPGRVSNVGWSPDGKRLVASVYPPDWSEGAVSEAVTTADFLRLQNADLYLYDLDRGEFVSQLTSDPGTEYGAFFSDDGSSLYYIWLHLTEDKGGLMRLSLDLGNGTSASLPAMQITQAGEDPGETPLGRVTTYKWLRGSSELVFEAGRPDGSGVIWTMSSDGHAAAAVAPGRKPQLLNDNEIIFQNADGAPQAIIPEVRK